MSVLLDRFIFIIYTYVDLGANRQISLRRATEKLGRKIQPPLCSFYSYISTMQGEGHQLFTPPDKASYLGRGEGGGRKGEV